MRDFSMFFRKNILRFAQNCVNLPCMPQGQVSDILMYDGRGKFKVKKFLPEM